MDVYTKDFVKVGFLIPTTTKNTTITDIKQTSLYKTFLPSLIRSISKSKYNLEIVIYIGFDFDDNVMITQFKTLIDDFVPLDIIFKTFDKNIKKGHLTKMWNILGNKAYKDDCDYFFQCGDDVLFLTDGWLDDCIDTFKNNNDIGIVGPRNNNYVILTQALFSRKHYKIFGKLLDEDNVVNYYLDDWYNLIYSPNHVYILEQHFADNMSGTPRYKIDIDMEKLNKSVEIHREILKTYLN